MCHDGAVALHHLVLALLRESPRHGYDLKGEFEDLVGPHFGALNIGHLYQLLERLVRDGLAQTHREPQETRPDRLVHTLTDKGRDELDAWLAQPGRAASGYRDEFFLKLAAARRRGDAGLVHTVVENRRGVLLQELRDLAALRATRALTTYDALVTDAAELQVRGQLELLDRIDAAAPALVAEAVPAPNDVDVETAVSAPPTPPARRRRAG